MWMVVIVIAGHSGDPIAGRHHCMEFVVTGLQIAGKEVSRAPDPR
jgi:hypothetical protein